MKNSIPISFVEWLHQSLTKLYVLENNEINEVRIPRLFTTFELNSIEAVGVIYWHRSKNNKHQNWVLPKSYSGIT